MNSPPVTQTEGEGFFGLYDCRNERGRRQASRDSRHSVSKLLQGVRDVEVEWRWNRVRFLWYATR
jgi:hypothetical protein